MATVTERLAARHAGTIGEGTGLWSWVTTVDHKRIGLLYLVTAFMFFLTGGVEAFIMRLQLARPDAGVVTAHQFNELFTMHGTTMIFLAIMPLATGFMNYMLPLMIGARDVAFPRLNALGYWLYLAGGIILNSSWLLGGAPDAGWFNYAPINSPPFSPGHGIDFYVVGLLLAGIGTLMTGINLLVTIINMRATGMRPMRLPLFAWASVVTSVLIIFAFPSLTVDLILLMFDRWFGTGFFNPAVGGNAILWQQLFWIFGHPEVYILILPAFGLISEVIPTFSGKPLFGYSSMVFALLVIGFLSFMVWTHHMFADGFGPIVNSVFAITSMAIAVPTGVKIFNWLATLWRGRLRMTTAMLYAIGFLATFTIGGFSGVLLAAAPADLQYNDSYFVVAHIHYVLVGGALFAMFAAIHYWYPKITGRLLDERLGRWHFWLVFIGFNATFFPMHLLGLLGMPRRIFTYGAGLGFTFPNELATSGLLVLTAGVLLFLVNLMRAARRGQPAGNDPWDGRTLEWTVPSPPPPYDFADLPLVRGRDPLWVEKQTGDGMVRPAAADRGEAVRMPAPSALPAAMALGLTIGAFGMIFRNWPLALTGVAIAMVALYRWMFARDAGVLFRVRRHPA